MTTHSSAMAHETPHETETIRIISEATRRRAESVIQDRSIDPDWRTIIRGALELNDPWLAELVSRTEAGENIVDTFESRRTPDADESNSTDEKIEALAEIICCAGDESAAALFVLMGALENSSDPKALANAAKHFAFTRCGELNVFGMVEGQLGILEYELLGRGSVFRRGT